MDRLDRISLGAVLVLLAIIAALVARYPADQPGPREKRLHRLQGQAADLSGPARTVQNLLEGGSFAEADKLIGELEKQHPYSGLPAMLRGDYHIFRLQPVQAMLAHRRAVDLDPDFLDKRSPIFQGKKIRNNLEEAREKIEQHADDSKGEWPEYRRVMFYLQRKIAGSCG
ncbi:MAG: hypothetical protein AB1568_05795 [Thermodesulfobacteriota bacterium]